MKENYKENLLALIDRLMFEDEVLNTMEWGSLRKLVEKALSPAQPGEACPECGFTWSHYPTCSKYEPDKPIGTNEACPECGEPTDALTYLNKEWKQVTLTCDCNSKDAEVG